MKSDENDTVDAPKWFNKALDDQPVSQMVEVADCPVHFLRWGGEVEDQPGLLFVHGGGAHAQWWSFIAPFFSKDRPVAAIDLPGMGDSGRRDSYPARQRADEIAAVLEAAKLGPKPIIVGHSFGGYMTMVFGRHFGANISGAVIVDSPLRMPEEADKNPRNEFARRKAIYPDFETVVGRFRLMPDQPCANDYIVDHIARHSVMEIDEGWTWKFDIAAMGTRRFEEPFSEHFKNMTCRKAYMYGSDSALVTPEAAAYTADLGGPSMPMICIPEAHHHVMLDQPLAFVAGLRSIFALWQAEDQRP